MVISTFLTLFVVALIPALVWLFFFLREDVHPEPKRMILYVFSLGGLATVPTLLLQLLFQKLVLNFALSGLFLIVGLAFFEEIFKFLAAWLAVHKNPDFDEPIDAMIYMIAAASGLATIENLFIVGNNLNLTNFAALSQGFDVLAVRFVGATLLHALTAGLIGYYWALGILKKTTKKNIAGALLLATALHAFFNYLVLLFQDQSLIYPSVFLIFIAFFVLNDFAKLRPKKSFAS